MSHYDYTPRQYAEIIGKSVSTARRRLEQMVFEGKAERRYYTQAAHMPRACAGMRKPPPTCCVFYRVNERLERA